MVRSDGRWRRLLSLLTKTRRTSSRSTWKLNAVARTFSSDSSVRTIASKQSGSVVSPCKKSWSLAAAAAVAEGSGKRDCEA